MPELADHYVYLFGNGATEGGRAMKALLGGKGANLAEMSRIGLPVPPGFTLTTEACRYVVEHDGEWPDGLAEEVEAGIRHLETALGRTLGDPEQPLLVSVRSGAAVSMPGMMDTVLDLGMNDAVVEGLAKETGNERFAYDDYRRFIDMFGDVVMGVDHEHFEEAIEALKQERGAASDLDLTADDLRELVDRYKAIYRRHTGYMFPDDPREQLRFAIDAVFGSWNNDRAVRYRQINRITGLLGTAVNVQAMVYGNMGERSGTGVCFTRNPSTGENTLYGEFLPNAQGEDVVAGIRTPRPIREMEAAFPEAYRQLVGVAARLERHYGEMQDIEFTVQEGQLFLLQTRTGKRTGAAAVRIAVEMVNEGLVDQRHAVHRMVEPGHLEGLLHPRFPEGLDYRADVIGKGLPASPGAAVGRAVFSAEDAEAWRERGEAVILVRIETSPEDVGGMDAAEGILTSRGGMTSHAAVVARGWGKPCVAGCGDIVINYGTKSFTNGAVTVREGDWISINGSTGEVIRGQQDLVEPEMDETFATFMAWADRFRTMGVRANADTPADAAQAVTFGAEGIGLCRTEHMFFEGERIWAVRRMIVAETDEERRAALEELLPVQRADFRGIFEAMGERPVTIRLLDPPLHEFLPSEEEGQREMARRLGLSPEEVRDRVEAHAEFNPMLGHRGCRLGVTHPEITAMQARAILEAAVQLQGEGQAVRPEIMVPLVGTLAELADQRALIEAEAEAVFAERGERVDYLVGTMIEVPRAALRASEIAEAADFFSFGTNDLTQMTFGYSRDDAGKFLPYYTEHEILPDDPFQVLDQEGVGQLVRLGTEQGRAAKPGLKVGICGEHGGEPESVAFFFETGLDYVSCSPFRVPIARLAAAQAALRAEEADEPEAAAPEPIGA
ncbi:MAG: pyruvate, phosphate dikinase [Rhodothermales bacterium]|nr:pyruvate, phosphate dikinase [Rhodothermales bacterium]